MSERERRMKMGRKKLLVIAALLSTFLIIPLAINAKLIDVTGLPLFSGSATSSSSTTVFVDEHHILDESLQAGSTFTVNVNVSEATDLFTWQINIEWNSSMLNVSSIIPGPFLAASDNDTSSEVLGIVINSTDNAQGYSVLAESILADVTGISGNGTLVSVEFLVLEYGWSNVTISVTGTFPTQLLDSTNNTATLIAVDGYFRNKLTGDINGDRYCDRYDFGEFAMAYGSVEGEDRYNREADFDMVDPYCVDRYDFGILAQNYGRYLPP
jgi:hypothetical protein